MNKIKILIAIFILIIVFICSLTLGANSYSFQEVFLSFFQETKNQMIIQSVRLPRAIGAIMVGATLAFSGVIFKIVLKNPLGDSAVLGVGSGGSFFVVLILVLFGELYYLMPIFAFLGGVLAFLGVLVLSYEKNKISPFKMILGGVAVNAFFSGLIGVVNILNKDKIQNTLSFLGGSLNNLSAKESRFMLVFGIIIIIIGFIFFPVVKMLRLEDRTIKDLGKNPHHLRLCISLIGVLLTVVSISFVGIIGFIGIAAPFLGIKIIKKYNYEYLIMSLIMGALLVLTCDLGQKLIFYPQEIPVGIITGVLGAPLFIYFLKGPKL